jgi:hypothetical protein
VLSLVFSNVKCIRLRFHGSNDEAEIDQKIIAKHLYCGIRICNVGTLCNCDKSKT